jgi:hypothetical protein
MPSALKSKEFHNLQKRAFHEALFFVLLVHPPHFILFTKVQTNNHPITAIEMNFLNIHSNQEAVFLFSW